MTATLLDDPLVTAEDRERLARDGFVVIRGVLPASLIEACKQALSDLMCGRIERRSTNLYYEAGQQVEGLDPAALELKVRRLDSFCDAAPALSAAAHSRRLHAVLDVLTGPGRTLFQEMALVKPPAIGGAKPWHQDAAYFLVDDPAQVVGTWTALDPATLDNGCMQFIAGSHREGPVPHVQESLASCFIRPDRLSKRPVTALPMDPGDTVVFHGLVQHFTDDNRSPTRRRALQFHYATEQARWTGLDAHERLYADEKRAYAGCVTPAYGEAAMRILRGEARMDVVPVDWA
ncbi:MAG: phytanoyl-CoA dioxygenase family protein [Burkholderiales bacterium]|nr:phytanoyl-CoA dioxygenase family protein [Burkholderiales bacterium]